MHFDWTSGVLETYWMKRPASVAGSLVLLFFFFLSIFWGGVDTSFHVFFSLPQS